MTALRPDAPKRPFAHAAPAGTLRALLHRALGALQLLLDDGDPVALHERGAALRRRARRTRLRRLHGGRLLPAALRRPARRSGPRLQPGDHRRRRADDARPPGARRRVAALLLHRARAARLRQRAAQAERLDARRQPLSRPAGAARPGVQHLLHGHQPRRVRVAAHGVVAPHALRLGPGVHVGRGRDAPVAARLHRVQSPRGAGGRQGRGRIGGSARRQPGGCALARHHAAGGVRDLDGLLAGVLPDLLHVHLLGAGQHGDHDGAGAVPGVRAARRHPALAGARRAVDVAAAAQRRAVHAGEDADGRRAGRRRVRRRWDTRA